MFYVLDGHTPKPVDDVMTWATQLMNSDGRRVAYTEVPGGYVSTVFVGLDQAFTGDGPPLLFETMIFGGPHDEYQASYATWDDAERGHAVAVAIASQAG